MKHQTRVRYPAPAATVMKMFADRSFHTRKLEALGIKHQVLDYQLNGADFSIKIERKVSVHVPFGKSAGESTVINEERWNLAGRSGRVQVKPQGMPLEMSCIAVIADEGEGSVVTYDWDVRSSLPVVGGTLEKFAVSDMDKRSAEETQAAIALLKDYR